ncbi:Centaurin-gamma-1A [Nymphon striatum]|nr:Centaurin-gamma-1A [Nymphon striatum]
MNEREKNEKVEWGTLELKIQVAQCSSSDSFVNSQEWTLSRSVPDLRLGIVGSLTSGKSALVHRYLTGSYMQEESPEGGRFKKEIVIDGQSYLLLIRDEGGIPESQFTSWVDAVIFVFSLENESSFGAIHTCYSKMSHYRNFIEIPLILVGTQVYFLVFAISPYAISESNPRIIDDTRARKLASDLKHCSYYETCATYGLNVERVFQDACQKIIQHKMSTVTPNNSRPSTPNHAFRIANYYVPSPTNNGYISHNNISQANNLINNSSTNHNNVHQQQSLYKEASPKEKESFVFREPKSHQQYTLDRHQVASLELMNQSNNVSNSNNTQEQITPCSTPTTTRKARRRSNLFTPSKKGEEEKKRNEEVGSGRAIPLKQGYLYKRSSKTLNKEWKKKYVTLCDDGRLTYHPSLHDYMEDVHGKEISLVHTTVKIPGQRPRCSRSQSQSTTASASMTHVNDMTAELNSFSLSSGKFILHQIYYGVDGGGVIIFINLGDSLLLASTFVETNGCYESLANDKSYDILLFECCGGSVKMLDFTCKPLGIWGVSIINGSEITNNSSTSSIPCTMGSTGNAFTNNRLDTPNVKKRHRRMKSGTKNLDNVDNADSDGYEFVIVSLDNKQWHFEAPSTEEREIWVSSIEEQILNSLQGIQSSKSKSKVGNAVEASSIQAIRTILGNLHCADCDAANPDWASLNIGILICIECSGIHRNLGSHISRVRSLGLDDWPPEHISVMMSLGNSVVNSIWESNMKGRAKPTPNSSREEKQRWIRAKYELKELITPLNANIPVAQQLIDNICRADIKAVAAVLAHCSTEHVNSTVSSRDLRTPIHLASGMGNLAILQLLIWANANATAVDQDGKTALSYARKSAPQDVQDLLKNNGCVDMVTSGTLSRRHGSMSRKNPDFDKLPASVI